MNVIDNKKLLKIRCDKHFKNYKQINHIQVKEFNFIAEQ